MIENKSYCSNCKHWEGGMKYKYPEKLTRKEQCLHPLMDYENRWRHADDWCLLHKYSEVTDGCNT